MSEQPPPDSPQGGIRHHGDRGSRIAATRTREARTTTPTGSPQRAPPRPLVTTAAQDLLRGLRKWELWGRLGWMEVKRRYRRTVIGPFWTSISLAIYVIAVGIVGAGLWHQQLREYLPFLVSGVVVWILFSTIVSESCTLLISGGHLFRHLSFEYSILAYALVWRNFIVFLHNILVYALIVAALTPNLLGPSALLVIPGMALLLINLAWAALLCGILCLRFRDLQQLIGTMMQIALLITPILWPPDILQGTTRLAFVELNPIYHLLDVVRSPLLGRLPAPASYVVVFLIATAGWALCYWVFRRFRKRIAYWS
jgi:ABC-type polysaccharide/polyol phosphate export permease